MNVEEQVAQVRAGDFSEVNGDQESRIKHFLEANEESMLKKDIEFCITMILATPSGVPGR